MPQGFWLWSSVLGSTINKSNIVDLPESEGITGNVKAINGKIPLFGNSIDDAIDIDWAFYTFIAFALDNTHFFNVDIVRGNTGYFYILSANSYNGMSNGNYYACATLTRPILGVQQYWPTE